MTIKTDQDAESDICDINRTARAAAIVLRDIFSELRALCDLGGAPHLALKALLRDVEVATALGDELSATTTVLRQRLYGDTV